jgi:hypothetical protein
MQVMRVPPYPIVTTWNLPDANYGYIVYVEDLVDHSIEETTITSDANGVVLYELPLTKVEFDREFLIRFYDAEHQHIIYEDNLSVIRPYVNPSDLGTTASEIKEYAKYEVIARSIIDTYINDGFYNHKSILQAQGTGTDYMPVWRMANRVLKVYENNVLIYDKDAEDPTTNLYNFSITLDNSAIQKVSNVEYSRLTQTQPDLSLPISRGDNLYGYERRNGAAFTAGADYLFVLDEGFRALPTDVVTATTILIDDIKCGKLDYYQRGVSSYDTDQFKLQFDKVILSGTGNILVDRMLDKYIRGTLKIGVI